MFGSESIVGVGYALGIDLGTTFTAAAVARDGGHVVAFQLGERAAAIPTVVVLRDDGEVLVGEAAERRSATEPARTAREFKRRIGDPVPLVIGGTPYGAETLLAKVLAHVIAKVTEEEGAPPSTVAVTHPATWGAFKLDLLEQAIREAGLKDVALLSEPEAAAVQYAHLERLASHEVVAVYDFGGGTFDAAVLRASDDGFNILGTPEGLGRLGGIDIDQAVLVHVDRALDGQLTELASDPAAAAGLARLHAGCCEAKEALSSDTDATVAVSLPGLQTEVRITRAELESMVRPRLGETIAALRRAVASTGLTFEDVGRVLLVGGTSRIPLVAQTLREELGRPVAVDANPKLVVAFGAARWAARGASEAAPVEPEPVVVPTMDPAPAPEPVATDGVATAVPASTGRPRWLVPAAGAAAAAVLLVVGALALGGGGGGGTKTNAEAAAASRSTTTSTTPTTTTPTTVASTPVTVSVSSVAVRDDTGSFTVELLETFETVTSPIQLNGINFAHVSGSADLAGYLAGDWSAIGVTVLAANAQEAGDLESVMSGFDPGPDCVVRPASQSYDSVIGSGLIRVYDQCGPDGASTQVTAAVDVPSENAVVFVGVIGAGNDFTSSLFDAAISSIRPA